MKNKRSPSVAIVGFSMPTLSALKYSQADEIWTLNHAFVMDYAIPRIDRLFELHPEAWYSHDGALIKYTDWLKEPHPFPIYMIDHRSDIPASVKYPFDEINLDIFSRLLRGGERQLYYTSSFSYMLALAIHEKVKRVEIYGIDMGNETEYVYQKPSGEFMIGVAIGRLMTIELQPESLLCRAQLYALERVPAASRDRCEHLLETYRAEDIRFQTESNALAIAFNRRDTKDYRPTMEASAYAAMYAGAVSMLEQLVGKADYYLGRQFLEKTRSQQRTIEEGWLALTNQRHAVFKVRSDIDEDGSAGRAWKEYLDARWQMFAHCGARQAVQKLIDECDMKVVPLPLRLEIRDDEPQSVVSPQPAG